MFLFIIALTPLLFFPLKEGEMYFSFQSSFGISDISNYYYEDVKDDPKKWTYFRIIANADDHKIFVKLQDDLGIEPKMEVYTIVVDIREKTLDPYILWGDIDSNPTRFPWSKVSKKVQKGLKNWTGSNKENLE